MIDASDLIVAPGFFDPHTHYDAQICWDPLVTCSSWHGVTSVVMGNCGVGIAPCKPEMREIATWDLVNVEGIPFDVLAKGITWDWQSFPEYMDAAERRGSAAQPRLPGAADAVSPFRDGRGVDGTRGDARGNRANRRPAAARRSRPARSDFRTTPARQHIGYKGRPLACRAGQPRGTQGLRQCAARVGQGRDRNFADPGLSAFADRRGVPRCSTLC